MFYWIVYKWVRRPKTKRISASLVQIRPNQHRDLELVRSRLRQCFRKVNCFLMPHPGLKVTNRREFDGRLEGCEQHERGTFLFILAYLFRHWKRFQNPIESVRAGTLSIRQCELCQRDQRWTDHIYSVIRILQSKSSSLGNSRSFHRIFRHIVLYSPREIYRRLKPCSKYVLRIFYFNSRSSTSGKGNEKWKHSDRMHRDNQALLAEMLLGQHWWTFSLFLRLQLKRITWLPRQCPKNSTCVQWNR